MLNHNLLTIEEWAEILGLNAWALHQYRNFPTNPQTFEDCTGVTFEQMWLSRDLSREEIERAIAQAEKLIADFLGYYPAPRAFFDIEVPYPPIRRGVKYDSRWMYTPSGHPKTVELPYGYFKDFGTQTFSLAEASAAVDLSSADGDALSELFTVTATVPDGTDADKVRLFFAEADRVGQSLDKWPIRPALVSVSGTTATIVGRSFLLVPPAKRTVTNPDALDATIATNYVDTVDVYVEGLDKTSGCNLIWTEAYPEESVLATVTARDGVLGIVAPYPARLTDGEIEPYENAADKAYPPSKATLSYVAGYPRRANGRMDFSHAQIVTWLSASLLAKAPCGCGKDNKQLEYYREVPSIAGSRGNVPMITRQQLNNPFGPLRGAVMAWNQAKLIKDSDTKMR